PNHKYFRNSLPSYTELGDPKQHEHLQFSAGGGDHFFAYTEGELRSAAHDAGLAVKEIRFFESPWISGHFMFRFLHRALPLPLLRGMDRLTLKVARRIVSHQLMIVLQKAATS
ncbi:MAG TPA: hypothetical protein VF701_05775, partial [Thermoanaerobaculia bacterium]